MKVLFFLIDKRLDPRLWGDFLNIHTLNDIYYIIIIDIIKSYGLENIDSYDIGRGTAWFDMGSFDDYFNTSLFVKTIQDRQGTFVNSPHEIAFRNKFIGKEEIEKFIYSNKNSEYAHGLEYLIS